MAYSEQLADRIQERLADLPNIEEKEMMGGLSFLYNGKMCIGIIKDEMVCRIDPAMEEEALERNGCRPMDFTGRPMKGWIMVEEQGMSTPKELDEWISLAVAYNQQAKKSTKKKKES